MRTVLICHAGARLPLGGLTRWIASFSELAGIVVIHEKGSRTRGRIRREIDRVGWFRFLDVLAFRLYSRVALTESDRAYMDWQLAELQRQYPDAPADVPEIHTHSPNTKKVRAFLRDQAPDLALALCKNILLKSVFTIPTHGTYVFHPGICPEYRNAHGCFWALARGDLERVGMSLIRIDAGIDTGGVYGTFSYPYDEVAESHNVIQNRVVYENLDALADRLREIAAGTASPIDTSGRESAEWGQPWLSAYLGWKRAARRRASST